MRPLIEHGYVYLAMAPLYKVEKGAKIEYLLDDSQLAEYKRAHQGQKYEVTYLKGLGELEAIQKLYVEHAKAAAAKVTETEAATAEATAAEVGTKELVPVTADKLNDGEYEIKVDLNKISLGQGNNFELCFMTADDAGNCSNGSVGIDSGWITPTQTVDKPAKNGYICNYDSATNTAVISFTSKKNNTQLAMNFRSSKNNNSITADGVADQLKDAITMTKK